MLPTAAAAVSSVNWSPTSVTKNREAGAVLSGSAAASAVAFMAAVFASDWALATSLTVNSSAFTAASLATITDTSSIELTIPASPNVDSSSGCYVTPSLPLALPAGASVTVAANPDNAYDELTSRLSSATSTVEIYIYQVTGSTCDVLLDLVAAKPALNVSLLVSPRVYGECDCEAANACYPRLAAAGIRVRKTSTQCLSYAHEKFWIVDGVRLGWSTGNLSPSDFGVPLNPSGVGAGADAYPPFGEPGWAKTNRDFTVWVDDAITAATYRKVMLADWSADGSIDWSPYSQVRCGF